MQHQSIVDAVKAVRSKKLSVREAARAYNIKSLSTIHNRVTGKVAMDAIRGRPVKYLSVAAQRAVVEVVTFRAKRGNCVSLPQLRHILHDAAVRTCSNVPSSFPSAKWTKRFVDRHPEVSYRKGQVLDAARFQGSNEAAVRSYYENLKDVIDKYPPASIWNCDETGVCAQGRRPPRVICPRGMRANCVRSSDRENVSIMACISAAGAALPPMYIFASKNKKTSWFKDGVPGHTVATTDSSYIQGHIFMAWLKWFIKMNDGRGPQLLILDGHFSHLGHDILVHARANNVDIFTLPSHTSSFLQPCDAQPFSSFKKLVEEAIHEYPLFNQGRLPTRDNLVALTKNPWIQAMTKPKIVSAFKSCGIYPLSLDVMLSGAVGDVGVSIETPMLSLALDNICVTDRITRKWLDEGYSADAMHVIYANLDRLIGNAVSGSCRKEKDGFLPDSLIKQLPGGGLLVTSEQCLEVIGKQREAKVLVAEEKEKKKAERLRKKAMKLTASLTNALPESTPQQFLI